MAVHISPFVQGADLSDLLFKAGLSMVTVVSFLCHYILSLIKIIQLLTTKNTLASVKPVKLSFFFQFFIVLELLIYNK